MNIRTPWLAALGLISALAFLPGGPALAQQGLMGPAMSAPDAGIPAAGVRNVTIPRGRSAIVDLPVDARDVLVTDPKIADAVLRSPRRIYVLGVASGQTDAVFFDAAGRRILSLNIRVDQNFGAVAQTINHILPGSDVHVEGVNNSIVLSGQVASAGDADKAVQIAQQFTDKPEQVLNLLSIAGKDQVMLKVRIVEVQRNIIKQLGFNLNAVTGQLGMSQFSFGNTPVYGVNGGFLGGSTGGGYSLNTTSQAVSQSPFSGLSAAAAALGGVSPTNVYSIVSQFLTGSGVLSAAQKTFSQTFLSNLVGTVQTQVTPITTGVGGVDVAGAAHTVTAASAGISTSNIATYEQDYLAGGGGLSADQRAWMNAFNTQLQTASTTSTGQLIVDHNNPLATVQSGLAGSSGLNQAQALVQAFEQVGLVRTLAEPNLTAISGESAKFLAGGEFPVPTGIDQTGQVTITFKPYGVGLGFTPVVLSDGRISLKISTEVSELSQVGEFTLSTGSTSPGLTVPGLTVRRAETTVELPSGGAMMIAGLLQNVTKEDIASLPGLTSLPVLGALFRSRDYLSGETELVVIVTPYVVKPVNPNALQTPADGLQIASDPDTLLLGNLNKAYKAPPTADAPARNYQGPVGYVIE